MLLSSCSPVLPRIIVTAICFLNIPTYRLPACLSLVTLSLPLSLFPSSSRVFTSRGGDKHDTKEDQKTDGRTEIEGGAKRDSRKDRIINAREV